MGQTASPPSRSRRALLRGRARAVQPLRPPAALAEPEFLDACTRCDACVLACPEHIIVAADGGFPELDFSLGECTFCGHCIDACRPDALDRAHGQPWRWKARIGPNCLSRSGIVCQSCREVCPERAIAFAPRVAISAPLLDTARCSGCGACVGVCPSSAIGMQQPQEHIS